MSESGAADGLGPWVGNAEGAKVVESAGVVGQQQGLDLRSHRRVATARLGEERGARLRRDVGGSMEQGFDTRPPCLPRAGCPGAALDRTWTVLMSLIAPLHRKPITALFA